MVEQAVGAGRGMGADYLQCRLSLSSALVVVRRDDGRNAERESKPPPTYFPAAIRYPLARRVTESSGSSFS